MPKKETRTTATFPVEREDGSREVVTEETTFLIHKGTGQRSPCQMEWFLDGDSLIRDPTDKRRIQEWHNRRDVSENSERA